MSRKTNFNISKKIYQVLKANPDRRMTAREIAKSILTMFPEECAAKKSRASVDFSNYTLEDQLVAEIGSRWRRTVELFDDVQTVEKRPREFYVSSQSEEEDADATVQTIETDSQPKSFNEHDLYPLLGQYVWEEFGCYSLRIDERKSKNNRGHNGNMWLYPDTVGMVDLSKLWSADTTALAKAAGTELAQLFSFEVKIRINRSNVREVFFQTLSNSAWAQQSYLAASEINSNAMSELRMLCASHGVGVIQIDAEEPSNSQILIPAQPKATVDWSLLDRLACENSDAKFFVKAVRDFHLTGETAKRNWDLVPKSK